MEQLRRLWKKNAVAEEKSLPPPPASSPSLEVGKTMSDTAQSTDPSRGRGVEPPSLSNVGPTTSASDQPSAPCTPSSTAPFQPDTFLGFSSETCSKHDYVANLMADLAKELALHPTRSYGPGDPIPTSLLFGSPTAQVDAEPSSEPQKTVSSSDMIRILTEELARHPNPPYGPGDPIPTHLLSRRQATTPQSQMDAEPSSEGEKALSASEMMRLVTEEVARHPNPPYGPGDPIPTHLLSRSPPRVRGTSTADTTSSLRNDSAAMEAALQYALSQVTKDQPTRSYRISDPISTELLSYTIV